MLRAWQILRPPILNDSAPRQPIDVKIPQAPERRTSRAERDWDVTIFSGMVGGVAGSNAGGFGVADDSRFG